MLSQRNVRTNVMREMSCVDFHYRECSVVLCERCWLVLMRCFFRENYVEKKYCPGLNMELRNLTVFRMLYFIIWMLDGLDPSSI